MSTGFESYLTAGDFAHVVNKMIDSRIGSERPEPRGARVQSINREERYCMVVFNGETTPVKIPYGDTEPAAVDQIVRIEGLPGDRYIAGVLGDSEAQVLASAAAATSATAQEAADIAIAKAATAQETADGKVSTYFQPAEPTGMFAEDFGDLWFDTDDSNKMYRWDGSAWVLADDQRIVEAITAAQQAATAASGAQSTADLKVTTFYQPNEPSSANRSVGDLWVDTGNQNELKRWEGSQWLSARDTTIAAVSGAASDALAAAQAAQSAADQAQAVADGAIGTFYQDTEPTGLNNTDNLGDLWVKTTDYTSYRWDGANWNPIPDEAIGAALKAAANAQTTADGKIDSFYQPNSPTVCSIGDLWFNTGDKNKQYYCSKASPNPTWLPVRDETIAEAAAAAAAADAAAAGAQGRADAAKAAADTAKTTADTASGKADAAKAAADSAAVAAANARIVDANYDLTIDNISSPNFGDKAGWAINKDGSAYFNDVTTSGRAIGPSATYDSLFANRVLYYKGEELGVMLDRLPRGVRAQGYNYTDSQTIYGTATTRLYNISGKVEPNRTYRIAMSCNVRKSSASVVAVQLRYAYNRQATATDQIHAQWATDSSEGGGQYLGTVQAPFTSGGNSGYISWAITMYVRNNGANALLSQNSVAGGSALTVIWEDIGPYVQDTMGSILEQKDFYITPYDVSSYGADGVRITDGSLAQGTNPFDNFGNRKTYFHLASSVINRLQGVPEANIDYVQFYLYANFTSFVESSFIIGTHNIEYPPAQEGGDASFDIYRVPANAGAGFWWTVPKGSGMMYGITHGAVKGIVFGVYGAAESRAAYILFDALNTPNVIAMRASYRA